MLVLRGVLMTTTSENVRIIVDSKIVLQGVLVQPSSSSSPSSRHSPELGAVLCHPHPLYGGSMDNNVLFAAEQALNAHDISTLRFNFRGVGQSTGEHGGGIEEAKDVIAACQYMKNSTRSTKVHVVAYSFGVFAFLHAAASGLTVESCALIAPPLSAMDFSNLSPPDCRTAIIVGDSDEYCRQPDLQQWLGQHQGSGFALGKTVLSDTDHFFVGSENQLRESLVALLK